VPSQVGKGASLGGGVAGVRQSRLRTQRERLAGLKDSMSQVAAKLRSEEPPTKAQRTALVARFNDLQRQVNELDGIVAGEGQEARAQGQMAGARAAPQRAASAEAAPVTEPASASGRPSTAKAGTAGQSGQMDVVA